jgi:hypothetical protein
MKTEQQFESETGQCGSACDLPHGPVCFAERFTTPSQTVDSFRFAPINSARTKLIAWMKRTPEGALTRTTPLWADAAQSISVKGLRWKHRQLPRAGPSMRLTTP